VGWGWGRERIRSGKSWDGSRSDSLIRTEPGFAGFATDSKGLLEIRISPPEADFFETEALDVHRRLFAFLTLVS
jgi:hypothetical protein